MEYVYDEIIPAFIMFLSTLELHRDRSLQLTAENLRHFAATAVFAVEGPVSPRVSTTGTSFRLNNSSYVVSACLRGQDKLFAPSKLLGRYSWGSNGHPRRSDVKLP